MNGPLTADETAVLRVLYAFIRRSGAIPTNDALREATGLDRNDFFFATYKLREREYMGWRHGLEWGPHGLTRRGALAAAAL